MIEFCIKRGAIIALILMLVVAIAPVRVSAADHEEETAITVKQSEEIIAKTENNEKQPKSTLKEQADESSEIKKNKNEEVEEEAEQEKPKAPADPRAKIINSTELKPLSPKSEELEQYMLDIMDDIITEDMTTYQQVKACYDYIIANTSYGSHTSRLGTPIGSVTCAEITKLYGVVEGYGAVALSSKVGMCNAYASAFILMAREIGLDANLVKGYTKSRGGGYAYHEWAEVNIDGTVYVFDPQLDQSLTRAGLGEYNVFCKTYEQISGRYSKI